MEITKSRYEKLLRKFGSDADKALLLPTLKSVIREIESNEDGEPVNTKAEDSIPEKSWSRDH